MICCMISASSAAVTTGAGEQAPMPPVFGPWSPSSTRLWSCEVASGTTVVPSESAMKDTSSPSRNSSTTTRLPASPNRRPRMSSSIASSASATVRQMKTPLPPAMPSALTTTGAPTSLT